MYEPLYSPTEGGPYGYRCKVRVMSKENGDAQ